MTRGPASEAAVHLHRRARGPARLALALLALDVVQAWLAMVGSVVFVERVWYALAGYAIEGAALEDHRRQFTILRWTQAITLLLTVGAASVWARRAHRTARALGVSARTSSAGLRLWWGVVAVAAAADLAVRVLSALGRPPLSLGGIAPFLLGEMLKIAASAATMAVIWRVHQAHRDAAVTRPWGGSATRTTE